MTFSPSTERSLQKSGLGAGGPVRAKRRQRVACLLITKPVVSIEAFAEACFRFSPQVALRGEEAVFVEIGGSSHLFSEQTMPLRLTALCQRFDVQAKVAIADDAPTALAMARFRQADAKKLPLDLVVRHDFQLLERTVQPTLPGPLPDDYAEWKPAPPPPPARPDDVFVKTPDLEGSKKGLGEKKRLRVVDE